MKKIIKKYNIYEFNELKEEIQKELIEKEAERQANDFCEWFLEELMQEEAENILEEKLGKNTCKNVRILYDLSYCQGSGAMVEFTTYLEYINKKIKLFTEKELELFEKYGSTIKVYHSNNYYYHENSFSIDTLALDYSVDYAFYNEEITENKKNKLEQKIEKFENVFNDFCYSINTELKKIGYSLIEDQDLFEEQAKNYLLEFEYLEDGTIFNV